jgi:ABC-type uncharacterized transport system substrate-binding protein
LKEAVPSAHRIAVLWNPDNPGIAHQLECLRGAAPRLDVALEAVSGRPAEINAALVAIDAARVDGMIVSDDPFFESIEAQLIAFAAERRLPALFAFSGSVRNARAIARQVKVIAAIVAAAADEIRHAVAVHVGHGAHGPGRILRIGQKDVLRRRRDREWIQIILRV